MPGQVAAQVLRLVSAAIGKALVAASLRERRDSATDIAKNEVKAAAKKAIKDEADAVIAAAAAVVAAEEAAVAATAAAAADAYPLASRLV